MRSLVLAAAAAVGALALAPVAAGSPWVRYGVHDDAWLRGGAQSLESKLETLDRLGVDLVRVTLRWDQVALRRPASPRNPGDSAYDWAWPDRLLDGLRSRGIKPLVTLFGTPAWANGGGAPVDAPARGADFGDFAAAAAARYPWVRLWSVWNEPNRPRGLRPANARVYVGRLLNPAYAGIHRVIPEARVAGGETAASGGERGVAPLAWIRQLEAAGAQLDAYAHHPDPGSRRETPSTGGCAACGTVSLASFERLLAAVTEAFGEKRIWLTAYGYETDPPDRRAGISEALHARYVAEAALRAYRAPRVDVLVHRLVVDEPGRDRAQSGLFLANGTAKMAANAFPFPLVQTGRSGDTVFLWGQIRPRSGRQTYRLQLLQGGRASWLGQARVTSRRGYFTAAVGAPRGSLVRVYSPRDGFFGAPIVVS